MTDRLTARIAFAIALLTPTFALAHPGDHSGMSLAQGVRHLLSEPDHLALFVAVGVVAAAGGWLLRTRVR